MRKDETEAFLFENSIQICVRDLAFCENYTIFHVGLVSTSQALSLLYQNLIV